MKDFRTDSTAAVDRIHRIFECLAEALDGLTVPALSERTGIPRSTLYRIVSGLLENQYLLRKPGNMLALGFRLATLGRIAGRVSAWPEITYGELDNVVDVCGQTVKLSVIVGNEVEVIARRESNTRLRITVDTGTRFPITAGAASKVLLAHLPTGTQQELIEEPLPRYTPSTIVDGEDMYAVLAEIRRTGFAYDRGEYVSGIHAVAVPVFDAQNRVLAAVSIAYPSAVEHYRTLEKWKQSLLQCTSRITSMLEDISL